MICKKCDETIPQGRVDLGYSVCVECSEVEKYGCVDVVNHKTGNTIEVLSRKDADQASKLTKRTGFGTLRSLRSGKAPKEKISIGGSPCSNVFIGTKESFERVGKDCMMWIELEDYERVTKTLDKAKRDWVISDLQYHRLWKIMKEFMPKQETPKFQTIKEKPVSEEITHVFRNWKNSKSYR
ncbi:MAG: hypothetical protein CMP57_02000 [Flavobacteriales bacterium]|nr:hypothetical protein [Flavobacteriales bacterium]